MKLARYVSYKDSFGNLFEELSKYSDIRNLNISNDIADHMVVFSVSA